MSRLPSLLLTAGILLQMQNHRTDPILFESETLEGNLKQTNKQAPGWFNGMLKFETHWLRLLYQLPSQDRIRFYISTAGLLSFLFLGGSFFFFFGWILWHFRGSRIVKGLRNSSQSRSPANIIICLFSSGTDFFNIYFINLENSEMFVWKLKLKLNSNLTINNNH